MESKGYVLLEKYEIGKVLGQGTFAKVHHGKNLETGANVAVKIIDKEKVKKAGLTEQIKREISVMKMVKHRNTVELYEVLATKSKIYLVMEYVRGGELFNKVAKGRLREETARKYFVQLVSAVDYCHSKGVIHRDLKPENLLLDDDGNLKVTDFGLCALAENKRQDGLLHTMCGTPAYVAPEVIWRKGYDGCKVDVWSCGVILYVLLAGYLPFQDQNLMEMYRKITKAEYKFPTWFSSNVRKLLVRILDPNPLTRISIQKILASSWCRRELSSKVDEEAQAKKAEEMRPYLMNAFQIISHSSGLDLSGFFKLKIREVKFSTKKTAAEIFAKIDEAAGKLGLKVKKRELGVMKMEGLRGTKGPIALEAQVFEITPLFHMVEMKKLSGDTFEFQRMINNELRPQLDDIVWKWQNDHDVTASC